jgi:beta-lactamase class A
MKRLALSAIILVVIGSTMPAQTMTPKEALRQLFTTGAESLSYTDQFKAALSTSQLQSVLDQISGQLGSFKEVRGDGNPYTVVFSEGTATALVQLDDSGRMGGLRFTQIAPAAGDLQDAVSKLEDLPGHVSYLITRGGEILAERRTDEALAVGSTFKLAVLAAVDDAVSSGELSWDQVVTVKDEWRSLPTGLVQDWPTGAHVTVETLATLMISQSDNTATDALIDLVGRRAVETYAPNSVPFLTTREAFVLKNPENAELKERYLNGSTSTRRRVLRELDGRQLPDASLFGGAPVSPEVEWFFSVEELCSLIERVSDIDLTTVNPGLANADEWQRVSYKGGSEPGVLNMTTRLIAEDGTTYCVSVTQNRNDAAIDQNAFVIAYQGILGSLR